MARPAEAKNMRADAGLARVTSPSAEVPALPAAGLEAAGARASQLPPAASPAPNTAPEAAKSTETPSVSVEEAAGQAAPSAAGQEREAANAETDGHRAAGVGSVCESCGFGPQASGERVSVCAGCGIAVHGGCYCLDDKKDGHPASLGGSTTGGLDWKCDCCAHGVLPEAVQCVYCGKAGDGAMCAIDTDCALWRSCLPQHDGALHGLHFGHLLCASWDPRRVENNEDPPKASSDVPQDEDADKFAPVSHTPKPVTTQLNQRSLLASDQCCFCGSTSGIRIQCRRLDCGRFFHAMCASQSSNGYLRRTNAGAISEYHAYCDRHHGCRENVVSLLQNLASKPISSLLGREDARKLQMLLRRVSTYSSIEALLSETTETLVGFCKKGFQTSRSIPPIYIMKHLQVLQFFLGYLPQLEVVYNAPHIPFKDRIGDLKLYRHLAKTFNPSRFISRYPGPLSQQHICVVCHEPFLERQHLLYCSHATTPHLQHWLCTTKEQLSGPDRDPASSSSSKKRKKHSATPNGTSTNLQHSTDLTTANDNIICSVCAAPMDLRGLTSLPGKAPGSHLGQRPSVFVNNGLFINTITAKTLSTANRSLSNRSSGVSLALAADATKTASGTLDEVASTAGLAPQKLEKINVQRTAKWLSCIAQIIRLTGHSQTTHVVGGSQQDPAQDVLAATDQITPKNVAVVVETNPSTSVAPSPAAPKVCGTEPAQAPQDNCSGITSMAATEGENPAKPTVEASLPKPKDEVQLYFDEAIRTIGALDPYALNRIEVARDMLANRSGPAVAVLRVLAQEYTRFVHAKHVRAVERVRTEKRKREELEAQKRRELERKRLDREAELALKKKMLAMRKKQRTGLYDQA